LILKPGSLYSMPSLLLTKVSAAQTYADIALTSDKPLDYLARAL
jgi:hypothetical protein